MKQFLESPNLLETIDAEAKKVSEDAKQLVAGLSEQQLNWKPGPDRWSIAQCLDHCSDIQNCQAALLAWYLSLCAGLNRQVVVNERVIR